MKRHISLLFTFGIILLCAQTVYGDPDSGSDEVIWTEESTSSKTIPNTVSGNINEADELFDEEESDNELLQLLKTDKNSDIIKITGIEEIKETNNPLNNITPEEQEKATRLTSRIETSSKTDTIISHIKRAAETWDYVPFDDRISFNDTIIVSPIFMPFVFDGKVLPDNYRLYDPKRYKKENPFASIYTIEEDPIFSNQKIEQKLHLDLNNYVIKNYPEIVKHCRKSMPTDIPVAEEITKPNLLTRLIEIDNTPIVNTGSPDQYIPKVKYWIVTGNNSVQFSQNYISPNWSAGGNSNVNLITANEFKANYDNKKKFKFDNTFLYRLSFRTGDNDELRAIRIGEEVFRYNTTLGVKAAEKWYYTITGIFETQFFKNHQVNTDIINSAFLAPMTTNIGLGMEYKTTKLFLENKYKKIDIYANVAPLSVNYKYSTLNKPELLARHGFEPDKNKLFEVGSKINFNLNWNFTRFIKWDSKFYIFTNYKNVDTFFENTFDFAVNRYFSTRIYLNLKYNSALDKYEQKTDTDKKYPNTKLQLNELLSFGFNYNW